MAHDRISPFHPKHLLPRTEKRTQLLTSITTRHIRSLHAATMSSCRPQLYRRDSVVSDVSDDWNTPRFDVSPTYSRSSSRDRFARPRTPPPRTIRRRDSQVSDVSDSSRRFDVSPVYSRTNTRNGRSPVRRRDSRSPSTDGGYNPPGMLGAGMPHGMSFKQSGYNPPGELGAGMPQGISFTQARFTQPRQSNLPVQGRCNDPDRITRVISRPGNPRPEHNELFYPQSRPGSSQESFHPAVRPGPDPRGPPPAYQQRPLVQSRNPAPRNPYGIPPQPAQPYPSMYPPGYHGAPNGRWY
jgi:hypothetical protein